MMIAALLFTITSDLLYLPHADYLSFVSLIRWPNRKKRFRRAGYPDKILFRCGSFPSRSAVAMGTCDQKSWDVSDRQMQFLTTKHITHLLAIQGDRDRVFHSILFFCFHQQIGSCDVPFNSRGTQNDVVHHIWHPASPNKTCQTADYLIHLHLLSFRGIHRICTDGPIISNRHDWEEDDHDHVDDHAGDRWWWLRWWLAQMDELFMRRNKQTLKNKRKSENE